jgi:hypothetical protein
MKKHPVEGGPLRMSRAIDSRHSRRKASRNGPTSPMKPDLPEKEARSERAVLGEKTSTGIDARLRKWKRPEAIQMLKNCAQKYRKESKNLSKYRKISQSRMP